MLLLNIFQSNHHLYYDSEEEITAGKLADSLLGLEAIATRAARIICVLYKVEIEDIKIGIKSFEAGSYKENFWVRLVFGKGRNSEKNIDAMAEFCGLREGDRRPLIAAGIAGLVLLAAWKWLESSSSPPSQHIEIHQHFENSFNTIGSRFEMTGQSFRQMLEQAAPDDELINQASRLVHPGGVRHVGKMTLDSENGVSLPADILNSLPTSIELNSRKATADNLMRHISWDVLNVKIEQAKREKIEVPSADIERAQISIRAIDVDRSGSVGAAVIPAISDRRLVLSISEDIDPKSIPIGIEIEADVTVFYRVYKSGRKRATKCLIRRVLTPLPVPAPAKAAE